MDTNGTRLVKSWLKNLAHHAVVNKKFHEPGEYRETRTRVRDMADTAKALGYGYLVSEARKEFIEEQGEQDRAAIEEFFRYL